MKTRMAIAIAAGALISVLLLLLGMRLLLRLILGALLLLRT